MSRPAAWLSWSSGKDSAFSLAVLREQGEVDVVGLVTTVNAASDRVAMHAVRRELLEQQADSVGLPLRTVELPWPCPNERYESSMSELVTSAVAHGISVMAFGDLYLADIRAYRERQLQGSGLRPIFPLWGRDTTALAQEMVGSGLRARVCCVDSAQLDAQFAGREVDAQLLRDLPDTVDRCGENGEFHTFASDGPGFRRPIMVRNGETVDQGGFIVTDLLPVPPGQLPSSHVRTRRQLPAQ